MKSECNDGLLLLITGFPVGKKLYDDIFSGSIVLRHRSCKAQSVSGRRIVAAEYSYTGVAVIRTRLFEIFRKIEVKLHIHIGAVFYDER